jgi:homoserine acetyltransferase
LLFAGANLNNSKKPIEYYSPMLCYRTHESFKEKFNRDINVLETFQVESWLNYHGKTRKRFQLSAYKMMNQLLKTIDITQSRVIRITYF